MITKVKLKNWRSHLESEFDFSTGTNALLGTMGSGKSSCMDAICFGLFGTFPNLQSKKIKLDDIIMKKPFEKNSSEVELSFQLNGTSYSVKRIIEKGKGTTISEIRENGKLLESPNSQRVTELVEKILKVNYELFSKAIYSEQNALDYFLTLPKGQRMKKIDELLMIDKFEKGRANAVSLKNKIVERKLGMQSVVDSIDMESLKKNILELENSLGQSLSEKENLKKTFGEASSEKNRLEVEVRELKNIRDNLEILKREEKGVASAIEEISTALVSLKDSLKEHTKEEIEKNLKEARQKAVELEKTVRERKTNYEKIASVISEARAKMEFLSNEKIKNLESEVKEKLRIKNDLDGFKNLIGKSIDKQMEEKKSLYEKFSDEVQEMKIRIMDLNDTIQQLSTVEGRCPICDSKLTKQKKEILIKNKKAKLSSLKKEIEVAMENKKLSESELKKLEESVKKLDEMVIEIKDFDAKRNELEESKKKFSELQEEASKKEGQFLHLRVELENMEKQMAGNVERKQFFEILTLKMKDYEERRLRLVEFLKHSKGIEENIKKFEERISGRNLLELEEKLKLLIGKEKEAETRISSFDQLIREKQLRIEEYEKKLGEVERQKEEIKKFDILIKDLNIFEKALEQTQIELRSNFVEAVNYTMNKLWPTLYPYQDFAGVQLSIDEGDYVLQLEETNGRLINADGIASGGERTLACLTLRIAFSLVLAPHVRMLILDEPTANLDSRAVGELATTLRERINEFIDQTFLITHQNELEDAVTGNAYRIEREKSKDGVTKVISLN